MKIAFKLISFVLFLFLYLTPGMAQEGVKKVVTAEIKVAGVCKMCEARIEKAALIKGVKFAEWKKETQMLKVIYKSKQVSEEDIHKAVAKAGHDTQKVKAPDKVYKQLPDCCLYRDGVEVH